MNAKLRTQTPDEARKEFLIERYRECERKLKWWQGAYNLKGYSETQIDDKCREYGVRMCAYEHILHELYGIEVE